MYVMIRDITHVCHDKRHDCISKHLADLLAPLTPPCRTPRANSEAVRPWREREDFTPCICVCIYVHIYRYTYTLSCICICIYICIHICTCVYTCMYKSHFMYVYAYRYTCTYYTYVHIDRRILLPPGGYLVGWCGG